MGNDVGANGQSVVTKKSGGKVIVGPDVCKTPVGSALVPIPYPNISQSSDLTGGSKSVSINGATVCLKGSKFSKSIGDQAGKGGGIISGKTGAQADPVSYSFDVKIEGKNVVRNFDNFVSNAKNTPPAPIMQSPVLPSTTLGYQDKKEEYFCSWKGCKGKHNEKISYKNNGCIGRGKYTGQWVLPWDLSLGVQSNLITLDHYRAETGKSTSLSEAKLLFGSEKYVTNKHHLIPIASMAKFPKLSHNAKLIGFDINDGRHGLCLPYFITDIFRHDLQSHKTNHPNYSKKVKEHLRTLEKRCSKYCQNNSQGDLLGDLTRFTSRLRKLVISWDSNWLLRKSAVSDRAKSYQQAGLKCPEK